MRSLCSVNRIQVVDFSIFRKPSQLQSAFLVIKKMRLQRIRQLNPCLEIPMLSRLRELCLVAQLATHQQRLMLLPRRLTVKVLLREALGHLVSQISNRKQSRRRLWEVSARAQVLHSQWALDRAQVPLSHWALDLTWALNSRLV